MAWEWYEHLIYPDWYMHNVEHDGVSAQASRTNSLEHRIDRLERKIEKLEHHILGLETLLVSHGIVPPTPEEIPQINEKNRGEPATFPARTEDPIECPAAAESRKATAAAATPAAHRFYMKLNKRFRAA